MIEVIDKKIEIKSRNNPDFGKQYSSLIYHLKKLESTYDVTLMPSHVTDIFWSSFIEYMIDNKLALSSIKTIVSQLRATIDWASKHNAKVSSSFSDFDLPSVEGHQISLTADEVSWIYHFDISTISRRPQHRRNLERVRDMFCLSCNLGQRYSDMIRVVPSSFDLIRSHTARRTFATINVLRGLPVYQIRKCTGHKTERAFNRYICEDSTD